MKKGDLVVWADDADKEVRKKGGSGPFVVEWVNAPSVGLRPAGKPGVVTLPVFDSEIKPLKVEFVSFDHSEWGGDNGDTLGSVLKRFGVKLVEAIWTENTDCFGYLILETGVKLTKKQRKAVEAHLCGFPDEG